MKSEDDIRNHDRLDQRLFRNDDGIVQKPVSRKLARRRQAVSYDADGPADQHQ